ncbi:MAG: cobalt-precorrin 5A hydrolase [Candidatus Brocadiia bacterium]
MKYALITLSGEGLATCRMLADSLPADLYAHSSVDTGDDIRGFISVMNLTSRLFGEYDGLVYVLPCGVAVRAIAPCLEDKRNDPAVVVLDVGARWSVSLLSGHEGGANALAIRAANAVDAEPVISTTSEAVRTVVAGIGCRRGVEAPVILDALQEALDEVEVGRDELRLLATADLKADERGLRDAAEQLGVPVRYVSSEEIRSSRRDFERSDFVNAKVGLPGVCEPAALLAGRRTSLLLPKRKRGPVTIALAKENCPWSG